MHSQLARDRLRAPKIISKDVAWGSSDVPTTSEQALDLLLQSGMLQKADIDVETHSMLKSLSTSQRLYVLIRFHDAFREQKIGSKR